MRDRRGIARAEQPPRLQLLPAVHGNRHDAAVLHFPDVAHPDQRAVLLIDLDKGREVRRHVLGAVVRAADAVPVVRLRLRHERKLIRDLLLRQRLHRDGEALLGQHGHTGVIAALAARTVEDLHRQRDGFLTLSHSGTIDRYARGVGHVRLRDDRRGVAGDDQRRKLPVKALAVMLLHVRAEVARGRELNVVFHRAQVQLRARRRIGQLVRGEHRVERLLVLQSVRARGHGHGVAAQERDRLFAAGHVVRVAERQLRRQRDGFLDAAPAHHGHIGLKQLVRRTLALGADIDRGIAARPRDVRPRLAVHDLRQLEVLRRRRGHRGQIGNDIPLHRALHFRAVPIDRDGKCALHRQAAARKREGHGEHAEALEIRRCLAIWVNVEISDRAVRGDVHRVLAEVRRGVRALGRTHRDLDVLPAQPILHHRQHVRVRAANGHENVPLAELRVHVVRELLRQVCVIIRQILLRPDGDLIRPRQRLAVLFQHRRQRNGRLLSRLRQRQLAGVGVNDRVVAARPLNGGAVRHRRAHQRKHGVCLLLRPRARVGQHPVKEPRGVLLQIGLRRGTDRLIRVRMAPDDDSAAAHLDLNVTVGVIRRDRIALSRRAGELIAPIRNRIVPVPLIAQGREVLLIIGDIAIRQHLRLDGPSLRDRAARRVHNVHIDDIGDHRDLLCRRIFRFVVGRRRRDLDHAAVFRGHGQRTLRGILRESRGIAVLRVRPHDLRLLAVHVVIVHTEHRQRLVVAARLGPDGIARRAADGKGGLDRLRLPAAARLLPREDRIAVVDFLRIGRKFTGTDQRRDTLVGCARQLIAVLVRCTIAAAVNIALAYYRVRGRRRRASRGIRPLDCRSALAHNAADISIACDVAAVVAGGNGTACAAALPHDAANAVILARDGAEVRARAHRDAVLGAGHIAEQAADLAVSADCHVRAAIFHQNVAGVAVGLSGQCRGTRLFFCLRYTARKPQVFHRRPADQLLEQAVVGRIVRRDIQRYHMPRAVKGAEKVTGIRLLHRDVLFQNILAVRLHILEIRRRIDGRRLIRRERRGRQQAERQHKRQQQRDHPFFHLFFLLLHEKNVCTRPPTRAVQT